MSEPLDLDALEARVKAATTGMAVGVVTLSEEYFALVAEVRRLRAALEAREAGK